MRILVTGASGQLGRELFRCAWPEDAEVIFLSHRELDITQPAAVVEQIEPPLDLVINAAAYTAVDRAETERALAYRVNADGAGLLASRCKALEIPLIHVSTDYVFSGRTSSPYIEEDEPSPLNVYGTSKLAGEAAVRDALDTHVILRTASVFSQFGQNFVKAMLRLGAERPTIWVVADQLSCPTAAADIATSIELLAERITMNKSDQLWGTYHFCGQPPISWFDFARRIFNVARPFGTAAPELRPISAAEYVGAATRPAYSALDCSKIVTTLGVAAPSWAARLPGVISAVLQESLAA
jgi:dTDP-4-dehydrorhamnose reductase